MTYEATTSQVPFDQRQATNHRLVNLILSGNTRELTRQDVYNQFTGKGALHGLEFSAYDSYYAFSEAKKQHEQGQFFTPDKLCQTIIQALQPPSRFKIADITCGKGSFFNYLPQETDLFGNELDPDAFEVCRYLFPQVHLQNQDFLRYSPGHVMDMIIGNPPFNIRTEEGNSQFAFVKKARTLLNYGGLLAFIIPVSFLADNFQDGRKIAWINEHFNFIAQCRLPKDSFDAEIDTKLLILQKKGVSNTNTVYSPTAWTDFNPEVIYATLIAPIYEQYFKNRYKHSQMRAEEGAATKDVDYLIRRRLWHIKENANLHRRFYRRTLFKLHQLKVQQKPRDMSDKEWDRVRLTPEKILSYLESAVSNQNAPPPERVTRWVKTHYGLKLKAYHPRLKKAEKTLTIHEILQEDVAPDGFKKLIRRKKTVLDRQNTSLIDLVRSPVVDSFLDQVVLAPAFIPGLLFQPDDIPTIRPNDKQKHDLGLAFQKRYSLLAWEQGGGKSVAGMLWLKFLAGKCKNYFVVGPAIAIAGTWTKCLKNYGFDFTVITNIAGLSKIKPGQLVLLSFDALITLEQHVKKFIRQCSYKVAVLVDESDELTNPYSQRSLASLNCFRKVMWKLLTTGTTTRNSINELYTQLELLYNNSTAFICKAQVSYHVDDEGDLNPGNNPFYLRPYPAHRGSAVFRACFCPMKSTVFGIQKDNQDVYNEDVLRELINKTIITRKFEEIVGEKKFTLHIHQIAQQDAERALYSKLMTEFMSVCYDYYTRQDSVRKEAGLRLVRQMQVLIKATSIPHLMKNYPGTEDPAKYKAIGDLIAGWPGELVTVGTTLKQAAKNYLTYLAQRFPNRKLFYIDGEKEVTTRGKILALFKASKNGIAVVTQQSLKSSVNLPFCNKCIIESLQWNIPKISQFFFRFIRFDSIRHTEVHFVNYFDTIEANLMALLMAKERLNDFIKTTNRSTTKKIYEVYGFDLGILDMMIQKNYDKDGKLYLTWGQQRIAA